MMITIRKIGILLEKTQSMFKERSVVPARVSVLRIDKILREN